MPLPLPLVKLNTTKCGKVKYEAYELCLSPHHALVGAK